MGGFLRIASVTVPIAFAVIGYVGTSISSINDRVDAMQTQNAATQQQTKDIDARLTRIEDKLDTALAPAKVLH